MAAVEQDPLRRSGRSLERDGDEPLPELLLEEPGLACCDAAAARGLSVSGERAGLPQLRLVLGTAAAPERAQQDPDEPPTSCRLLQFECAWRTDVARAPRGHTGVPDGS